MRSKIVRASLISCVLLSACAPREGREDAAVDGGVAPSSDSAADVAIADSGVVADASMMDSGGAADAAADGGAGDASACRATAFESRLDLRYHSIAGVDPNLLSLDLYLPTLAAGCAAPPLVVYVHGGGWAVGDKRNQIEAKVRYFTGEGYAFASLNYRLSPASAGAPGVQYPVHNQDVARALAWLRERASTYGYRPERITLFGHSAGAGIATLVGTDPQFLSEHGRSFADLSCVAALDTEAYDVALQMMAGGMVEATYRNAFGANPMDWQRASPLLNGTLVAANRIVPFLVVTRGTAARRALSGRFVDALRSAGVSATLHTAEGLTHEEVNDVIGLASDRAVMPAFGPFIERCARGQ